MDKVREYSDKSVLRFTGAITKDVLLRDVFDISLVTKHNGTESVRVRYYEDVARCAVTVDSGDDRQLEDYVFLSEVLKEYGETLKAIDGMSDEEASENIEHAPDVTIKIRGTCRGDL